MSYSADFVLANLDDDVLTAFRGKIALAATIAGLVAACVALCLLAPLRPTSGDTVPARLGGAVLRCAGSLDLARVDWIRREAVRDRAYYYALPDEIGQFTSVFGPAPAIVEAIALGEFGDGDRISDDFLRRRERDAAAVLLALTAVLIFVAARAHSSLARSTTVAAVGVLSFAGAATLGQGLWQSTVALPWLVGALATMTWHERRPRLGFLTPTLLLVSVMLRPTIGPLGVGLGLAWLGMERRWKTRAVAAAFALAAVAPLVIWNVIHLWSPLPIAQWQLNGLLASSVLQLDPKHALVSCAGLLASPARGLVWFAPLVLVGVIRGLRSRQRLARIVAITIIVQALAMALFFKWHGGLAFGPRLLAEASWLGIWLALGAQRPQPERRWVAGFATATGLWTAVVGVLGLWRFHPDQWETRRVPDRDPAALWDVTDSPLTAIFGPTHFAHETGDSPPSDGLLCDDGQLRTLPNSSH